MNCGRPTSTKDLLPSERSLLDAMRVIDFGQIEFLRIRAGEPVLDPWPAVVRHLKFGVEGRDPRPTSNRDFDLKREVADLFEYTRDVEDAEIRALVVRHGLPFSMEVELSGRAARISGGGHDSPAFEEVFPMVRDLAHQKALYAVGRCGFTPDDREDVASQLVITFYLRFGKFRRQPRLHADVCLQSDGQGARLHSSVPHGWA
jgi:hypothetical protein